MRRPGGASGFSEEHDANRHDGSFDGWRNAADPPVRRIGDIRCLDAVFRELRVETLGREIHGAFRGVQPGTVERAARSESLWEPAAADSEALSAVVDPLFSSRLDGNPRMKRQFGRLPVL